MVGSKHVRLRVGVIGLGRLWETRHKPSLARLDDRFRVTAVYDPVFRRAELEATQIGCAACEGLSALVERPDVDVIYLLSRQWFGLHPIALACAARKPVYCALPLADELTELEALAKQIEQSGIVFMPEFARRCYPATLRLKELLATQLGPPRLAVGHTRLYGFDRYAIPGPTTQIAPAPLTVDPGSYLIDWCCFVFQAYPYSIQGFRCQVLPAPILPTRIRISRASRQHFQAVRRHRCRMAATTAFPGATQVAFCRLRAFKFLPNAGQPGWRCRRRSIGRPQPAQRKNGWRLEPTVGDVLNDQFHRLVRGHQSLAPTIRDALEIARLTNDLRRSQRERAGTARPAT